MRKYRKFKELSRDKMLTPDEQAALSSAPDKSSLLGKRDYAIIKLFLNTGLRKAELLSLKVGDLKSEGGRYWLIVKSKGGTIDEQDLTSERAIESIKRYLTMAGHGDKLDEPLFKPIPKNHMSKGGYLSRRSIDKMLKKYAKDAGIQKNITAHILRHTFGSEVYANCKDLALTQRIMRHRSLNSTMIYLHSNKDRARKVLNSLDL